MTLDQALILFLLAAVLGLFVSGRWRYDVVAILALVALALTGLVAPDRVFSGFSHPATVSVAMVTIIGRGLQNSGAVDLISRHLLPPLRAPTAQIGASAGLAALLSTVMNNIAALSILMPAVLQSAAKAGHSPATVLMPLAFSSILGGLVTAIGTPPNIIISTFRTDATGQPFGIFDFAPVGGVIAVVGVVFVAWIGWRLIPASRRATSATQDGFAIEDYVGEMIVGKESPLAGLSLREVDERLANEDAIVLDVIRYGQPVNRRQRSVVIAAGDRLVIEADVKGFDALGSLFNLTMAGAEAKEGWRKLLGSGGTALMRAVVLPGSPLLGRNKETVRFRRQYGLNLLALSRRDRSFRGPLRAIRFRAGDVLLFEGQPDILASTVGGLGCLPLSERAATIRQSGQALLSMAVFVAVVALTAFTILSLPVALLIAVCAFVLLNVLPPRDIYTSVDWPIIVLLGALIPIGGALQSTGTTTLLADLVVMLCAGLPSWTVIAIVLLVSMTLSDVINNAATAVVMAPVAIATADALGHNVDPFLMAVAVGASCAFLTPIGHQNNTLVLGPGGYAFGDFWRMGLPLEIIVTVTAVPLILWFWPL